MSIRVIPTIVPRSQQDLLDTAHAYDFTDALHIDINDGLFASPHTWPFAGDSIQLPTQECHIHLMMQDPTHLAGRLVEAGVASLYIHTEADSAASIERALIWRAQGLKQFGISFLIDTPLNILAQYVSHIDSVLLMSVAHIGEQGGVFDDRAYDRIREVRRRFPDLTIAIDGGIRTDTARVLVQAGADILYVGSAIAHAHDPHAAYTHIIDAVHSAVQ